jgi:hypothetical protein
MGSHGIRTLGSNGLPPPINPGSLSNLTVWLDLSTFSGLYQASGFFTPVTADGQTVRSVENAGGPVDADSSVSTSTWIANGINGLGSVRTTTAPGNIAFASNPNAGASAGTMIVVQSVVNETLVNGHVLGGWGTDATNSHWPFSDGIIYDAWGSTVRKTTGNPALALTVPRIYVVQSAASLWRSYIDGTPHFSTATNTVGWGALAGLFSDTAANPAKQGQAGDVGEIIVCSRILTASEINGVASYLVPKWAVGWSLIS